MRFVKVCIVVLICLAAVAAAFSAGYATHLVFSENHVSLAPKQIIISAADPEPDEEGVFRVFWEAWHLLEQNFMGELPTLQKMSYGAIRGVLAELNDPHTVFVEPNLRELEKDEHRGRFGGIGAWVYVRENDQRIALTPQEGGPAARAGIRDGDVVVQVDDVVVDLAKMTRDDVVALIRGPVGTKVRIVVERQNDDNPSKPLRLTFEIIREEFETPSVEWRMLDDRAPGVGYVHIILFTERTAIEVDKAIRELTARGARRLILDLRDNPGGLLDAAIDVTGRFLDGGVVMYEQKRDGSEQEYSVQKAGSAKGIPLIVLINGGTASASEIVAGALRDHGRSMLVGERTHGKGSVQLVFDLSDGSSIHITVARWLTPHRHQIDGVGIQPDVEVPLTQEDRDQGRDPQLAEAIARLIEQTKE